MDFHSRALRVQCPLEYATKRNINTQKHVESLGLLFFLWYLRAVAPLGMASPACSVICGRKSNLQRFERSSAHDIWWVTDQTVLKDVFVAFSLGETDLLTSIQCYHCDHMFI